MAWWWPQACRRSAVAAARRVSESRAVAPGAQGCPRCLVGTLPQAVTRRAALRRAFNVFLGADGVPTLLTLNGLSETDRRLRTGPRKTCSTGTELLDDKGRAAKESAAEERAPRLATRPRRLLLPLCVCAALGDARTRRCCAAAQRRTPAEARDDSGSRGAQQKRSVRPSWQQHTSRVAHTRVATRTSTASPTPRAAAPPYRSPRALTVLARTRRDSPMRALVAAAAIATAAARTTFVRCHGRSSAHDGRAVALLFNRTTREYARQSTGPRGSTLAGTAPPGSPQHHSSRAYPISQTWRRSSTRRSTCTSAQTRP